MGELYAEFVLTGRISYADAVYLFYYKFPEYADSLLTVMNTVIRVEGRADLILRTTKILEIKEKALEDGQARRALETQNRAHAAKM